MRYLTSSISFSQLVSLAALPLSCWLIDALILPGARRGPDCRKTGRSSTHVF